MTIFACLPGVTFDNFDAERCVLHLGMDDIAFEVTGNVIDGTLNLDDAVSLRNGSYVQFDLPFGTYLLNEIALPNGAGTYVIPQSPGVEGAPVSGYAISLDKAAGPDLAIAVYHLSAIAPR